MNKKFKISKILKKFSQHYFDIDKTVADQIAKRNRDKTLIMWRNDLN